MFSIINIINFTKSHAPLCPMPSRGIRAKQRSSSCLATTSMLFSITHTCSRAERRRLVRVEYSYLLSGVTQLHIQGTHMEASFAWETSNGLQNMSWICAANQQNIDLSFRSCRAWAQREKARTSSNNLYIQGCALILNDLC